MCVLVGLMYGNPAPFIKDLVVLEKLDLILHPGRSGATCLMAPLIPILLPCSSALPKPILEYSTVLSVIGLCSMGKVIN